VTAVQLRAAGVDQDDALARIVVVGHVDHGKSTLIGRLMYDLGLLHQSKIDDVLSSSARRGVTPEWSYVLDSLQEERDQAITIDTTRLWFSYAERRYTLIDAPGHRQFLANMLSGAAEADAAILVVDAVAGIGEQTLRHAYLLGFLGIPHVIVAVNKIDLIADPQARVAELTAELREALQRTPPVAIVPISATLGRNVAKRCEATTWYTGPTIIDAIAAVRRRAAPSERRLRIAVQDVYRRDNERIVVGTLAGGTLAPGRRMLLMPGRERVVAERLVRWPDGDVPGAAAGESVGIVLDGDRFVGRGDTLVDLETPGVVSRHLDVEVFWLDAQAPRGGETVRLKHGTQNVSAVIGGAPEIFDIEAARLSGECGSAQHNIVRLRLHAARPVAFDRRADDAAGARCVVLRGDRVVAIGFTVDDAAARTHDAGPVTLAERERRAGHRAGIVWLTGLSAAGKSTIAQAVERRLFERGISVSIVDGDALRARLNTDLGFSDADRTESVRRAAGVADVLAQNGHVVLVSLIAPFAAARDAIRAETRHPFHEIYVNASLEACEQRDPKGLYRRARAGLLPGFTGIDSQYEPPEHPDLELRTDTSTPEEAVARLMAYIEERVL
jgi:bifunctional enzyme CysN/CysC